MGTNELNFIEPQQKMFTMSVLLQSRLPRETVAFTCGDIKKSDIVLVTAVDSALGW